MKERDLIERLYNHLNEIREALRSQKVIELNKEFDLNMSGTLNEAAAYLEKGDCVLRFRKALEEAFFNRPNGVSMAEYLDALQAIRGEFGLHEKPGESSSDAPGAKKKAEQRSKYMVYYGFGDRTLHWTATDTDTGVNRNNVHVIGYTGTVERVKDLKERWDAHSDS